MFQPTMLERQLHMNYMTLCSVLRVIARESTSALLTGHTRLHICNL